jgi:hypothetical protein
MKYRRYDYLRALTITLIVLSILVSGAVVLLGYVEETSEEAQIGMVRNAVRNAVLTCYAVEGAYPQDVEYLIDNYGLAYDQNRFFISYDAFASNVFPDIRVNLKGADEF